MIVFGATNIWKNFIKTLRRHGVRFWLDEVKLLCEFFKEHVSLFVVKLVDGDRIVVEMCWSSEFDVVSVEEFDVGFELIEGSSFYSYHNT